MSQYVEHNGIRRLTPNSSTSFDLNICVCGHSTNLPPSYEWGPFIRDYYIIQCCVAGCGTLYVNDIPVSYTHLVGLTVVLKYPSAALDTSISDFPCFVIVIDV